MVSAMMNINSMLNNLLSNSVDKEERIESANNLKRFLITVNDSSALNTEPFYILSQLERIIYAERQGNDLKKSVANLAGTLGFLLGNQAFINWLKICYENEKTTNEQRLLLLQVLNTMLEEESKVRRMENAAVKATMSLVTDWLGQVDSGVLLIPLLLAVHHLSATYQAEFEAHFTEVVDIVIGWYIDVDNQGHDVQEACERLIKALKPFWIIHLTFTLQDMLSQFLKDAQYYLEDAEKSNEPKTAQDLIFKSSLLIRGSRTILCGIADCVAGNVTENPVFSEFIEQGCVRMCSITRECWEMKRNVDKVLSEAYPLMALLVRLSPEKAISPAMQLFEQPLTTVHRQTNRHIASLLHSLAVVVKWSRDDHLLPFVQKLISADNGHLIALRFHPNKKVTLEVFNIFRALLEPNAKRIQTLQKVYKSVVSEMVECVTELRNEQTNGRIHNNEWILLFHARLIAADLAIAKNSIVAMWSIQPNLIDLLSNTIDLTDIRLMETAPSAHYGLLYTLKLHCCCHDNFINSSTLVTYSESDQRQSGSQLYFATIVQLISHLYSAPSLPIQSRQLCMEWIREIIDTSITLNCLTFLMTTNVFTSLIASLTLNFNMMILSVQVEFVKGVIHNIHDYLTDEFWFKLIDGIESIMKKDCMIGSMKSCGSVTNQLMSYVPLYIISKREYSQTMAVSVDHNISNENVSAFLDFILATKDIDNLEKLTWMVEGGREGILYAWNSLLWSVPTHIVNNKLKTSLGKPLETLVTIENCVKSLASQALNRNDKGRKKHSWFVVRSLLNFMENLEKVMYNAYAGTAQAIQPIPKAARSFFSTNGNTCREWLARVRPALMTVAFHNGLPAMTLRLAHLTLQDLTTVNMSSKIETLLMIMVEALQDLGCWQEILGLKHWLNQHHRVQFDWLEPAALITQKKYEEGLALLTSSSQQNNPFVQKQMLKCYNNLRDWEVCRNFFESIQSEQKIGNPDSWQKNKDMINYAQVLGSWNSSNSIFNGENGSVKDLQWDQHQLIMKEELSIFRNLKTEKRVGTMDEVLYFVSDMNVLNTKLEVLRRIREDFRLIGPINEKLDLDIAVMIADWKRKMNYRGNMEEYLTLSKLHRKCGNLNRADKLIAKYVIADGMESNPWGSLPLAKHLAKLQVAKENDEEGFTILMRTISMALSKSMGSIVSQAQNETLLQATLSKLPPAPELRQEMSSGLLCLCDWLRKKEELGKILLLEEDSLFIKLMEEQLSLAEKYIGALDSGSIVGALLTLSAFISPQLSKAQHMFADWAYTAGRHITPDGEQVMLSMDERRTIDRILLQSQSSETCKAITQIVSTIKTCDVTREVVERKLGNLLNNESVQAELIHVWEEANARLLLFNQSAASAYFAFLSYAALSEGGQGVRGTLRLLSLLVKQPSLLNLEEQFNQSPSLAWVKIIPQILSRLNHKSEKVREILLNLLLRMGDDNPSLLVFPAIVGVNNNQGGPLSHVVNGMSVKYEQMIKDVSLFVTELENLALLSHEKWLYVLAHMEHEINKRVRQMNDEVAKTNQNVHLTKEQKADLINSKREIYFSVVKRSLEDLVELTRKDHDSSTVTDGGVDNRSFHLQYESLITPILSSTNFSQIQKALVKLLNEVRGNAGKRNNVILSMSSVCPRLVSQGMKATQVPLPGHPRVTLHELREPITVLPTKTRPKKIRVLGSDGRSYGYLLKGLEDLHLDQRIMQFLQISNTIMAPKKKYDKAKYVARSYAVTPLGGRCGLIEWVEGPLSVFSLYRKWQIRQAALNNASVLKPSDIYFNKMTEAQNRQNDKSKSKVDLQLDVVRELIRETPGDLVARELWATTNNPEESYQRTMNLTNSLAVMSVIGFIIGLGDRHLDNLLIDLKSGEIVHIDYNICFEKGLHLRVPETVPFRMTQNIQGAMGLTGVQGLFRTSCEHVLSVMRKEKETLLTLLEAFVYDPLVDWTQDANHNDPPTPITLPHNILITIYSKFSKDYGNRLASTLALDLFKIRRQELYHPWMENKKKVEEGIKAVEEAVKQLEGAIFQRQEASKKLRELEEQAALQLPLMAAPNSTLTIEQAQLEIGEGESLERSCREGFLARLNSLKTHLPVHHKMIMEIRYLLRILAKMEDKGCGKFNDYLSKHREWIELLGIVLKSPVPSLVSLQQLLHLVPQIYSVVEEEVNGEGLRECSGNPDGSVVDEEEVNQQGMNIWRRVRSKLQGTDKEAYSTQQSQLTVKQHVNEIINDATDTVKLSLMYEGWTSWV